MKLNLPNRLTLLRIFMIPVFTAVYFVTDIPYNFVISAVIFTLAAFTDFLDGYLARKYNLVTSLGKFLDPIADKVLVSTAFIVMLISLPSGIQILPWYAGIGVAVILARELIVSGFRMVAASRGEVLAADKSGKIKTFSQDISIILLLISGNVSSNVLFYIGFVIFWIAVALTVYSGTECIVKNRKVLKDDK